MVCMVTWNWHTELEFEFVCVFTSHVLSTKNGNSSNIIRKVWVRVCVSICFPRIMYQKKGWVWVRDRVWVCGGLYFPCIMYRKMAWVWDCGGLYFPCIMNKNNGMSLSLSLSSSLSLSLSSSLWWFLLPMYYVPKNWHEFEFEFKFEFESSHFW